jgi:SpoVK/Ycf46/Vps4 family AAA+-type ATPase
MKANGGVLVIDDFGRQRLEAAYLLNRWVTPLERQVDHLSLHSGARFEVPFDVIPIFVSNLPPMTLADDAFLRRIRYKIEIPGPDTPAFVEILKRECQRNDVSYDEEAATYLINEYFGEGIREMRGCHPRDFVEAIADAARYQGGERSLTASTIDEAHGHYFVED